MFTKIFIKGASMRLKFLITACLFVFSSLFSSMALAAAPAAEVTWLGHSAFKVVTPTGKVLYIDPWIKKSG